MNQERTLAFWSGTKKSNQEQRKGYNLWTRNTRKILLEMVPGIWGLVPKPEKSQIRNEMEQRTQPLRPKKGGNLLQMWRQGHTI